MNTMQALQQLGFTEYEARAYMALVDGGELNGYELAKESGIPRANIYAVLEKLLQRGAAQRLQRTGGLRYLAIPPKQLLHGVEADQKRVLATAKRALARRTRRREPAAVFNLRDDELLVKARQLIGACKKQLLIAIQPTEAALLAESLKMARERDVVITTLCLRACEQECGGCQGEIYRYELAPDDGMRWLVLVADHGTTLIGQLGLNTTDGLSTTDGISTEQRLVVRLATAYIEQSLTLALLNEELAGRLDGLLTQDAQRQLTRLCPEARFTAFTQSPNDAAS